MPTIRVLSQQGAAVDALVAARLPGVEVRPAPTDGPLDAALDGDVLLTLPWGAPNLAEVARRVRWVHALSTGVDRFPMDRLPDALPLTCSRGASAVPIAEFVLAAMLAFEKRLPETWVHEPPAQWALADLGTLDGGLLGIVGVGAVGAAVAERALAFGMRVQGLRRTDAPLPPGVARCQDVVDTVRGADHVVLAAPATSQTRGLVDAQALAVVKRGAHLVNVGRGSLVDDDALLAALDRGDVARATLDVVEPEPLPAGHRFYDHPQVRLSPHVSWSSPGALERMVAVFAEEVARYVAGQPPARLVDRVAGY